MSPEYDALRQIRSQHVPAVKAEIGDVLKAARLKKGLALEAVARQTRISKRYLEALEGDKFEEFPALVYLRGFLKGYCDFLETDFGPLWEKVEAATAPPPPASPEGEAGASAPPASATAAESKTTPAGAPKAGPKSQPAAHAPAAQATSRHLSAAAHGGGGRSPGGGAAGAIVFSLIAAAGLGWWIASHRAPAARAPEPEPPKALQPLAPPAEQVVTLRLKDDAWVRVTLDGQVAFEGRAPRASSQEWRPAKTLGLRTTSPEALSLELNGQPRELGAPGPDGEYRLEMP